MAKPICVIYFPESFFQPIDSGLIYEYMAFLNGDKIKNASVRFGDSKEYWKDYYWFCFYDHDIDKPELKVFHEKDFTEIQFNELKELITKSIEESINKQK